MKEEQRWRNINSDLELASHFLALFFTISCGIVFIRKLLKGEITIVIEVKKM